MYLHESNMIMKKYIGITIIFCCTETRVLVFKSMSLLVWRLEVHN